MSSTDVFYVENSKKFTSEHFRIIRSLYLPWIGPLPCLLFEVLADFALNNSSNFNAPILKNDFLKQINMSRSEFNKNISYLEGAGLVQRLKKNNLDSNFLFVLLRPLTPKKFDNNSMVKNLLLKQVGSEQYEYLLNLFETPRPSNKSEYIDISTKFSDLFETNFNNLDEDFETQEIELEFFADHETNIKKLSSEQFIKYSSGRFASLVEKGMIKFGYSLGFKSNALNLLIDYSVIKNGKIVPNYIKTLLNDYKDRSIMGYSSVKREIEYLQQKNIINQKKQSISKVFWGYDDPINEGPLSINNEKDIIDIENLF